MLRSFSKIPRQKCIRQQVPHGDQLVLPFAVRTDHGHFRITEFRKHLAANAAGYGGVFSIPNDCNGIKLRSPSYTALNIAVRSAQFEGEYAAFSMLHPR